MPERTSVQSSLGRDGRVTLRENVHAREFDGELIVLDLEAGEYFALNATGARMWQALVAGRSPVEVARELEPDYDVGIEQLVGDCVALADELLERGFLRRRVN